MKLSVRIPLLFGVVILIISASIGFITLSISSKTLESTILNAIRAENESNAEILSLKLTRQLDILGEIAIRLRTQTMDWAIVQPSLRPDIPRTGSLDMAMVTPEGMSHYVLDNTTVDVKDREYFKRAMAGEKNIAVVFSRLSNKIVVLFAVPIYKGGDPSAPVIGVLIARKDGGQTLSELVAHLEITMPSGYNYLVDMEGTIIAHPNTDLVTSQFNPLKEVEKDPSLKPVADLVTEALNKKNGTSRYVYQGKKLLGYYVEVPDYPWVLFSTFEKSDVDKQLAYMRFIVYLIGIAFVVVGLVVAFLLGKSIAGPIASLAKTVAVVGEGDLTQNIVINSKDEVGNLAHYFNETMGKLKNLVILIKQQAGKLNDISNDLASNMSQTAAAVNEITSNIQNIKGRVLNQISSVSQTNATMENITVNINKLSEHVDKQTSSVSNSSSAIEEMLASIESVTQTLIKNADNVKELSSASGVGHSGLQEVAANIQEIARESEGLLEINAVMENIASQTNLLSMNAAIEAAHAGEAGRGFAVVAGEIRKLAESSSAQSKTISNVLKKIKGSIDKITQSTNNVLTKFEAIDGGVKVVAIQEENIRNAMEEQGQGSKQVLESIGYLTEITRQVKSGSMEMLDGSKEVVQESRNVERTSQEITEGMNEMANESGQINTAITHVNEISNKNREGIATLLQEVARFKVE